MCLDTAWNFKRQFKNNLKTLLRLRAALYFSLPFILYICFCLPRSSLLEQRAEVSQIAFMQQYCISNFFLRKKGYYIYQLNIWVLAKYLYWCLGMPLNSKGILNQGVFQGKVWMQLLSPTLHHWYSTVKAKCQIISSDKRQRVQSTKCNLISLSHKITSWINLNVLFWWKMSYLWLLLFVKPFRSFFFF